MLLVGRTVHSVASDPLGELHQAKAFFGLKDDDWQPECPSSPAYVPRHWQQPFLVLQACYSQWRWRDGQLEGLCYARLEAFLRLSEQRLSPDQFRALQRLEAACCDYWHSVRQSENTYSAPGFDGSHQQQHNAR